MKKKTKIEIEGELKVTPLLDILQIINLSKKSGLLSLYSKEGEALLLFREGDLIYATNSKTTEKLTDILLEKGLITENIIKEALKLQKVIFPPKKIGQILVEKGYINKETLNNVLKKKVIKVVVSLFKWKEGKFYFREEQINETDDVRITLHEFEMISGFSTDLIVNQVTEYFKNKRKDSSKDIPQAHKEQLGGDTKSNIEEAKNGTKEYISPPPISKPIIDISEEQTIRSHEPFKGVDEVKDKFPEKKHEVYESKRVIWDFSKLEKAMISLKPNEIPNLILEYAQKVVKRIVVFSVKSHFILGVTQYGLGILDKDADEVVEVISIPLDTPSTFQKVVETKQTFYGKLINGPWDNYFIHKIGGELPEYSIILPLIVNDRVTILIYGDNFPDKGPIYNLETLEIFLQYAGKTLTVLLLEQKIQELGQLGSDEADGLKGEKIADKYIIEKRIGRGGFSEVFLCKEARINRFVAIKRIFIEDNSSEELQNCLKEIDQMAKLEYCPYIIKLYTTEQDTKYLYIITEYANEGSLKEIMKRKKKFELQEAFNIIEHILLALSEAHKNQIVHRDIKPENILCVDGIYKVSDFGVAKTLRGQEFMMNTYVGTPKYMAPEVHCGKEYNHTVDLYATGLILYELLTGEYPFSKGRLENESLKFPENFPPNVAKILKKALAFDPEKRYQSAEEMLEDVIKCREKTKGLIEPELPKSAVNKIKEKLFKNII